MNSNRPTAGQPAVPRSQRGKSNLVALGSAAVLAIYAAGYLRTAAAAERLASAEKKQGKSTAEKTTSVLVPARSLHPTRASFAAATYTYTDGVYYGWGHCRHGDLQSCVTIQGGRIVTAAISECRTRYPQKVIAKLPPQVVARQSPSVDWISGATESSEAFSDATLAALLQANK
jgi:uncharacterized protein with FMN-binding domain